MWIPKWERDRRKGVDSPIPTQVVSNEEFIPRPQTKKQKHVEFLVGELAAAKAQKLGMDRRSFMRTSMGMATAFVASNMVYGPHWDVHAKETMDSGATDEKFPKGEYFIIDVQSHFTNGITMGFRRSGILRGMGFNLTDNPDDYAFPNFVKEFYFDSETSMIVIAGVPDVERHRGSDGKILKRRSRSNGLLPSWLMSEGKHKINKLAKSQRALCQGNCAPNHYWDRRANAPDKAQLFDQMEREMSTYKIDSWKWYCHTDPGRSGGGFKLDDEKMTYPFYEKSRKLGMKTFSVHKGFSSQSRTLGHLAHPGDIEKAAKDWPDFNFVIYHSALQHGPGEPGFTKDGFYDPTTGDFKWHADLMKIKQRNPNMNNVYCEIGTSFALLSVVHPEMCQHLIGKNIKYYGADHVIWGTDCVWWGSPQWIIEAFKRFQISDELCEKFGYAKLTKEDKAKIFGLNAAKVYGVDVAEKRKSLPGDALDKLKTAYLNDGGLPNHAAQGWVRADG